MPRSRRAMTREGCIRLRRCTSRYLCASRKTRVLVRRCEAPGAGRSLHAAEVTATARNPVGDEDGAGHRPLANSPKPQEQFFVGSEDLHPVRVRVGDLGRTRASRFGQRSRKRRSASSIWRSTIGLSTAPRAGSLARAERPSGVAAKDASACSSLASNRSTIALMA